MNKKLTKDEAVVLLDALNMLASKFNVKLTCGQCEAIHGCCPANAQNDRCSCPEGQKIALKNIIYSGKLN